MLMPRLSLVFSLSLLLACTSAIRLHAQGSKQTNPRAPIADADKDHAQERARWFYRGRLVHGQVSSDLRRRAYKAKLEIRAQHAAGLSTQFRANGHAPTVAESWSPLGPVPLASDATGNGTQDYHQVAGRATAIAIDPADSSGNTVYIAGAQGGVWKSTNAANPTATSVVWTPLTDDQPTLSIGALAIQPGNTNLSNSVILAATGEADNSGDSYFGLGILRSADSGNTWALISTANGGLSFSGLGGTRIAFSTANGQTNTVVSAMATTSEGMVDGAITANTMRGLYTSLDAGQSWSYNALIDPGGATDATSSTSVVYNQAAGLFFAAVRYHGFYSSPDGMTWTRLGNQPAATLLSTSACPPLSTSNSQACPIYRGEISVVPGRNEMYAWFISISSTGTIVDGGIWQSLDGGATWSQISDTGITTCGDTDGCGVEQGDYNLALLAVANGAATDLYAAAINLYKCGITTANLNCTVNPFVNLTHVYGCDPIGALAHVHPDQHALTYTIPTTGSDANNALMFFANDGGIYRALNGFSGLNTGSCTGSNLFDDLNQNLGSMTQFVSFSQHPSDANTLLGGTQDNGSPATDQATSTHSWGNVLGGDGGYNAIDPNSPTTWYASNPDTPPGGLGIQACSSGVSCNNSSFTSVVTSATVGGDDGGFYFPYLLDPQSTTAMLVGTCRVWRGSRTGSGFTVLSPNFDTFGSGTCAGTEVNQVRALAAGGQTDANGSKVLYATTDGFGPIDGLLSTPSGGHVWVTTDATAGTNSFVDVTSHGPGSTSINPNQFPISAVAIDPTDTSGSTAYVTMMGFTGGPGHVWKTVNAGGAWTDYTANLPDSPVNAVVVDSTSSQVYVGTDVGVFASSSMTANWSELGPNSLTNAPGFLPDVAVTALALFKSGGQSLLRASTYGRGIWQFDLAATPTFQISVSNSTQTISIGQSATFNGSASALNGYSSSVTLSCAAGPTAPPATCTPSPSSLTPAINTPFNVTASGAVGDYFFNVQGAGSDTNHTTQQASVALHVLSTNPDFALSEPTSFPTVNAGSSTTSGPISITASSGFTGLINLTCSLVSGIGNCSVNPSTVSSIPSTANVTVNATSLRVGSYQLLVQGTSSINSTTHSLLVPFNVGDYQLSAPLSFTVLPGAQATATLTITGSTFYSGRINATCDATSLPGAVCNLSPVNPILVNTGATVSLAADVSVPVNAPAGNYNITVTTQDTTGVPTHSVTFPLTVGQDFKVSSATPSQTVIAGQTTAAYSLTVQPVGLSFTGAVTLSCSSLPALAKCLFNPATAITPGNSAAAVAMTISTAAATTAGTDSVTITGTSGSLSHSTTASLIVTTAIVGGTLQLAVAQSFPANVTPDSTQTAKVTVTPSYTGSVNASCDASAMPGAQCTVTPANPVAITASMLATVSVALNVPTSAAAGSYNISLTVADASGQPTQTLLLPLTVIQDFEIFSSTPSQTVTAGQTTGPYNFTVQPVGSSFTGAVTLTCSGLPLGAQCLFNPSTAVTPGTSAAAVIMTISTATSSANNRSRLPLFYAMWLILPGMVLVCGATGRQRMKFRFRLAASAISLFAILLLLTSCGGGSNNTTTTTTGQGGTKPGTYNVIVTGTSGTLTHQAPAVILIIN